MRPPRRKSVFDPKPDNCDPPVGLKLLRLRLLGAKALGLAIGIFLCDGTVIE